MKIENIGIFVSEFPSISETFIVNQITSLINLGYNVNVYARRKENLNKIHKNINRYNLIDKTIYAVPEPLSYFKRIQNFISEILFKVDYNILIYLIRKNFKNKYLYNLHLFFTHSWLKKVESIDTFIVHFGYNAIEIANLKKSGFYKNKKLIVFFHGYDLERADIDLNRYRYKEVFDYADYFVVNTPYLRDILTDTKPSLNNILTIPVGLSLPLKKSEKDKFKTFTVVFCGRLIPLKGINSLIEIANILVKNYHLDIQFKIIGEGEMFNDLSNKIKRKNLNRYIKLLGAMSQEEVFSIYQQSHLFILPGIQDPKTGRAETQGLVIQEAQYFELPVLVSDAGGMKYGLIDEKTGYVLPQNDNLAFAEKIKTLYEDEDLRNSMGKAGKIFVEENYDINKLTTKLLKTISNH